MYLLGNGVICLGLYTVSFMEFQQGVIFTLQLIKVTLHILQLDNIRETNNKSKIVTTVKINHVWFIRWI